MTDAIARRKQKMGADQKGEEMSENKP